MILWKKIRVLFFVLFPVVFLSCAAGIEGELREGGSAELVLKTSLGPRTAGIIRSVKDFMGRENDAPILDGPAVSQSMSAAPGIKSVALLNTGPAALEGTISLSNAGDFLAAGGEPPAAGRKFITYAEGALPGTSSIIISLDRDSAPALISRLSPDVEEYLQALMAPAVLGEASARQEYLDILTMVYGKALSDEVAAARIRASIGFPRPVTAVEGGRPAGRRAEFDIPLADILVLEKPLRYEVRW